MAWCSFNERHRPFHPAHGCTGERESPSSVALGDLNETGSRRLTGARPPIDRLALGGRVPGLPAVDRRRAVSSPARDRLGDINGDAISNLAIAASSFSAGRSAVGDPALRHGTGAFRRAWSAAGQPVTSLEGADADDDGAQTLALRRVLEFPTASRSVGSTARRLRARADLGR
jgi:hypothetical protein